MASVLKDSERFVELTHGQTRYLEMGSGKPVILLHGAGYSGGATSWFRNIEGLAAKFRVLAPDMLGWGPGDSVQRHLAFPYLVEFVREFQDALFIERSHLVGHSLGGWVSQLFAYESPQRVDQLVLVASAGNEAHHVPPGLSNFSAPTRDEIVARVGAIPGLSEQDAQEWADAEWRNISGEKSAESFAQMLGFMTFIEERERYVTPRRWSKILPKTLIISGSSDAGYPPEVGKLMAETMPDARQLVFDAGHMIPLDVPKELNEALLDFLV